MGIELSRDAAGGPLETVHQHIRLENAHDLAGVIDTFGSAARYDDEPWDEHHVGREAVQSFYQLLFQAVPDLHIEVSSEHVTDAAVIVECVIHGTHQGTWRGLPATGHRIQLPLCGVYTFGEDGKLAGERIYYDRATLLRQLGLFREPVKLKGRLLLFLNHPASIVSGWLRGSKRSRNHLL